MKSLLDVADKDIVPMSKEDAMLFVNITFTEVLTNLPIFKARDWEEQPLMEKAPFLLKILLNRAGIFAHEMEMNIMVPTFLSSISKTPGEAVMWAYTLYKLWLEIGVPITMVELTNKFPQGFPSESAMEEIWNSQKGRSNGIDVDNMLDYEKYWK